MDINLKLKTPNDNPDIRGRNGFKGIQLFIPNIYKDCGDNIKVFIAGLTYIFTLEFICAFLDDEIWYGIRQPLCFNKDYCPINEIIKRDGFKYKMKLSPNDYNF